MRIVVSGGGSGGHIFPALAVAEGVRRLRPEAELLFIGGTSGMECQIVPERGVPFQAVTARKLRKLVSPSTLLVLFALFKGYREARQYLRAFRAQAVVGTGGYVAAGAVLAGAKLGLPTVIVSPDVVPGRTNRMLARSARRICIAFEETRAQFPGEKCVLTGLPLRAGVVAPTEVTPSIARCEFESLAAEPFTVLIIGGSQGAQAINRLVLDSLPQWLDAGMQVLHQTGTRNLDAVRAEARSRGILGREGYVQGYLPVGFLDERQVPLALRSADLIVCRGGISTLSEAMVNGLPAIVIPLPTAYADHQTVNARALEKAQAAYLRPEGELTAAKLTADIQELRTDTTKRAAMQQAMRTISHPRAADLVAQEVFQSI